MTDTNEAAAATEATKPAKEKPIVRLWVGTRAARDGTTYNEFQKIVLANAGSTEDELKKLIPQSWAAPNSDKYKKSPDSFIQGYLTAGLRKGYFVDKEEVAQTSVPVLAAGAPTGDGKKGASKLTRAGKDLVETILAVQGEGDDFVTRDDVDLKLGKPMSQLGKGVIKLKDDGFIELGSTGEGDDVKETVRVTDAGRAAFAAANAPAAEEPAAQ